MPTACIWEQQEFSYSQFSLVMSSQGRIPTGGPWTAGIGHPGLAQPL